MRLACAWEKIVNWLKYVIALALFMGSMAPDMASADRWRGHRHDSRAHIGLSIGVPLYWSWPSPYYAYPPPYPAYSPYYYPYPPAVTIPSSPPVYIEREDSEETAPRGQGYWYYCDRPDGYYPYVKECPGGWERVAPKPSR